VRPARLLLPLTALLALLTACSSGDQVAEADNAAAPSPSASSAASASPASPAAPSVSPSAAPEAAAEPATVTIADFAYDVPASVAPGAQVQIVNEDREAHTFTLADGGPSVVVQGGASGTVTAPDLPGTYGVVCDFHGNMTAELVVA